MVRKPGSILKVLVAYDDSNYSAAALELLFAAYRPERIAVRIVHVVEPMERPYYPELVPPYPVSLADINKKRLEAGKDLVASATRKVQAAGFSATGVVRQGHVRTTLVAAAASWKADLILIGSHGRRGVARVLLGSVSDYVARHAPCSVEIVRLRKKR